MYDWNTEFKQSKYLSSLTSLTALSGVKNKIHLTPGLMAIKSCIEADDPMALKDLLNEHKGAHIYALIQCFTIIPALKCIEYLITEGTPTDVTFDDNPFGKTAQQYFDDNFNVSTNSHHLKVRTLITGAMSRGRQKQRKISYDEHTILMIPFK
jgi:hypothetical protein